MKYKNLSTLIFITGSLLLSNHPGFPQEEFLTVLANDKRGQWMKYSDVDNTLYKQISSRAVELLDERSKAISAIETKEDWLRRQRSIKEKLNAVVGPFPKRTPLNARVTGQVVKDLYTIEKVVYESQPGYFLTACLFIPNHLEGKAPAILYCAGHGQLGFREKHYQNMILNLVTKGFVVLAFDPIGQGERIEYFSADGSPMFGAASREHTYAGAQCFMNGTSPALSFIWDGIRSLDYLVSRDEVDVERIGCHGHSGGGTLSTYIAAFDDRIKAVAPHCYITNFKRLFESNGPQDAEQNFFHGLLNGIDQADLLEVRFPKPALIACTTRDIFSIQGTRETYQEVKSMYDAFGQGDNIQICEDNEYHGYTVKNREAIYAFFQKHLHLPGSSKDSEPVLLSEEDLQVSKTGNVLRDYEGKSTFDLNLEAYRKHELKLVESRRDWEQHIQGVRESTTKLFEKGLMLKDHVQYMGGYQQEGYQVNKYFLENEEDGVLPFLLMEPSNPNRKVIIYLHEEGKAKEALPGGKLEQFVKRGYTVIAADLPGIGETGPGQFDRIILGNKSYSLWFGSILIGQSIVEIRTAGILRLIQYLKTQSDLNPEHIIGFARDELTTSLLQAAILNPAIESIVLESPLHSFASIVEHRDYDPDLIHGLIAGSLRTYDFTDLLACVAPRKLLVMNPVDHRRQLITEAENMRFVRQAYQHAEDKYRVVFGREVVDPGFVADWLE